MKVKDSQVFCLWLFPALPLPGSSMSPLLKRFKPGVQCLSLWRGGVKRACHEWKFSFFLFQLIQNPRFFGLKNTTSAYSLGWHSWNVPVSTGNSSTPYRSVNTQWCFWLGNQTSALCWNHFKWLRPPKNLCTKYCSAGEISLSSLPTHIPEPMGNENWLFSLWITCALLIFCNNTIQNKIKGGI